ncbi:MAG: nucleotide sugar dehydrogenase [Candidatus Zixiibacteriota bacterium]
MKNKILDKIKDKSARIGIIGLGYVGLPLAVEFAESGYNVTGIDISKNKVKLISGGHSDIDDIPDNRVAPLIRSKFLKATTDQSHLSKIDCVFICVPTPLSKTKDPDISYILAACEAVVKYLHKDMLVVLESTTYPGTTDEVIKPRLEESGLKAGLDFYLAFSPERVDPGNAHYTTKNTPRVVGGITDKCTQVAKTCYEQVIPNIYPVSSTRAAEMVKLLENTFRSVNIGLVNEVALMCHRLNMDVWEIINAAATKPFGFMPFYPGPGLGGHCIPIDPHYLSWKLKTLNYFARFIELAGDINSHMPEWVVERITSLLNEHSKSVKGSQILVLGVAYKKNIQDIRESPALDVIELLVRLGAKLSYNDPYVPELNQDFHKMKSVKLTLSGLKKADLVVILTDHKDYDYGWICENANLVFDTRNATINVTKGKNKIHKL